MTRLLTFLLALILAAVAQRWLADAAALPRDSLILFLIAGGIFAAVAGAPVATIDHGLPPRRKWQYTGIGLAGLALLLTAIAATRFWAGDYGGWAFWLWLGAILLFVVSLFLDAPSPDPAAEQQAEAARPRPEMPRRLLILLLLLILAVAAAARFAALDTYPNGCQSDECNNGLDALKWLSGDYPYRPYAETNEGQATLFTYLIALAIALFGQSVETMRMVSALAGTLTVLAFYFLARELYGQRIALLTAALLAADRWHLTFSRIVYELILMPLVLTLQALFLIKALRTGRRRWWALSGMMLALGMNTYTAYRVVPFFFAAYFLYWLITHRRRLWRDLEGMVVFAAGAAVAVAPLAAYTLRNWNVFISRINHISIFRDVEAAGSYAPLWANLRKTLYMFNWQGDNAALNNLPGAPLLQAAVAVLFVLALIWALRWAWKEIPFFYLLWFGAVASVAVLSVAHEAPTARRPIALVPVIYLLIAALFDQVWRAWQQAWGAKRWRPLAVALTALVLLVAAANLHTYFRVQAVNPSVWLAYSPNESAVGAYLAATPTDRRIYMTPQYTHHSAVRFIGGPHDILSLNLAQHVPLREDPGGDVDFILEPVDERLVPLLQQLYPAGRYEPQRDRFDRPLFLLYHVPRAAFDQARGLQSFLSTPGVAPQPGPQTRVLDITYGPEVFPPFTASYEGALLAPRFGDYGFQLSAAGGEAILYLDESEALRVTDGVAELSRTLAGGFQGLRLSFQAAQANAHLTLAWRTPDAPDLAPVGEGALYTLPGAANGLIGYYYANGEWLDPPIYIQRDLFILPNNILREPFSIRWVGKVAAPSDGRYIFGTRSDDGSLVYINGQLVVDNSGSHGAEYREGVIDLTAGFHDVEVRYNELGGSREMQLWWQPPTGGKSLLPGAYLYPVEEALPVGLELPPPPLFAPPAPAPDPAAAPVDVESARPAVTVRGDLGDFPAAQPAVLWTYGACGSDPDQLNKPIGLAVAPSGDVFIADMGNQRIVHLDAAGAFRAAWGRAGQGPGQFTELFDLAVAPTGEIAALDAVNQVISLWTPAGEFLRQFGAELTTYRPRGLGVAANGDYFIADTGGVRVLHVGPEGALIAQFGGPDQPLGPGQPTDAAAGPNGLVYVTEPIAGALWRIDLASGAQERVPGPEANTIESPHLAVGGDGRVYLTDPEGARVLVYSPALQPLAQIGERGVAPGQFGRPVGIAIAPDGSVIVADPDLCRVTAFNVY
ncbi:MAG: glycosyltransferase family 39 protein [Caldilineales bacterium]|nr:glycosyltransferase family 39 protein [Caldilineales bacterium]